MLDCSTLIQSFPTIHKCCCVEGSNAEDTCCINGDVMISLTLTLYNTNPIRRSLLFALLHIQINLYKHRFFFQWCFVSNK